MQYLLTVSPSSPDPLAVAPLIESHSVEAIIVGVIVGAAKVWELLKKRRHHRTNSDSLDRIERNLSKVRLEVRDLRAQVKAHDGAMSIRDELRELRDEVKGILERERDRLSLLEVEAFRPPRQSR